MLMKNDEFYKNIGFRCGLEIHQRLYTHHKLFCSCNAVDISPQLPIKIHRMQRAVAGELGEVDRSTGFESKKNRIFTYNTFRDNSCLVDLDEEPPHDVNQEAIDIALLICASLYASAPDEIEPMRKEVVDGSDPSAFQRTMLVGYDGSLDIGNRKIKIPTVFLEEESSGIESSDTSSAIYDVDRLGVPLIEIDTDPELRNPTEAKEVAARIGMMLRLTHKVQRGIGSIRQDVNISVKNGARVEIKGMQDLDSMDIIIEREVERQLKLLEIMDELGKRKAAVHTPVDLTKIFKSTNIKVIQSTIWDSGKVYGIRLEKFAGLVGTEINPNRRLGSEISDYAKMAGVKGVIHSDEDLKKYEFSDAEIKEVKSKLEIREGDAFVIVSAKDDAQGRRAIELAKYRSEHAISGIPLETRAADSKNMVTRFMRPLPGGSRMYPETDAKPIIIEEKRVLEIKKQIVDIDRSKRELEKLIGNNQLAEQMLRSYKLPEFNFIISKVKVDPLTVAAILLEKMKELRRNGFAVDDIDDSILAYIFEKYAKKEITKIGIEEILKAVPLSTKDVDNAIKDKKIARLSKNELGELIAKYKQIDKKDLLGKIMSEHRLNVDAEDLKKAIEESR